jgi:hypothetical protein
VMKEWQGNYLSQLESSFLNLSIGYLYTSTQVSEKMAAETGDFRRRFKPPVSQDAKPSHPAIQRGYPPEMLGLVLLHQGLGVSFLYVICFRSTDSFKRGHTHTVVSRVIFVSTI